MTPTEVTTILRQFNDHRRGCDVPSPKPSQIGRAIDAAVEMIERLEAAERSDAESIAMYRKARDERDALLAKIEEMEKQEPSVPDSYWKQAVEEIADEGFGAVFKRLISDRAAMLAAAPGAKGE